MVNLKCFFFNRILSISGIFIFITQSNILCPKASYPELEKSFGMFWRFAPMADPYVDEWHSRDLDAWMLQREVDAVKEWKSTK